MQNLSFREVGCKTVLHEMYGTREYTANFYRGCSHGCVYCYAPSLIHDERKWGTFVDVKVNAAEVLERELRRSRKGIVFLSSASDPYQPAEARYRVTGRALEALVRHDFPVIILTRSPLVLRDIQLLKGLSWVRVGFSISSIQSRVYEPGVVPVARRIETMRALGKAGIKTWVSMAPLIPGMMDIDVQDLLVRLKEAGVGSVSANALRFQGYAGSKQMFEEAVGVPASQMSAGAEQMMERVRSLIERAGFERRETFFEWKPVGIEGYLQEQAAP